VDSCFFVCYGNRYQFDTINLLPNNFRVTTYVIARLSELFEAQHETVSSWLDKWETEGLVGLYDCPRSGRPARFTVGEQAAFLGYIDENPHQPKAAAARLLDQTGKEASLDTFKRILKKVPTSGNVVGSQ
jgi:transposase